MKIDLDVEEIVKPLYSKHVMIAIDIKQEKPFCLFGILLGCLKDKLILRRDDTGDVWSIESIPFDKVEAIREVPRR